MSSTILCIETATTNCSVAVGRDGKILEMRELNKKQYSHAEKLHLFMKEIMEEAGLSFSELDAIAVSKGPGSYTGLRIGVSAAKGLCFALGIPLISIPTLESLATQVDVTGKDLIVPLLDARRMEVYSAVFDASKKPIRETQAEILTDTSFQDYLTQHKVYFIGDGVEKFQAICTDANAVFVSEGFPSAKEMLVLADKKYQEEQFEDVAYFEPYYLKDFVAGKKKS